MDIPDSKPANTRRAYHHGELRKALIAAGEHLIATEGLEGFSLRACAKKVGVSPAAPAHHFGNAAGLLEAIAVDGFDYLSERMAIAADERQSSTPSAKLAAMARAYVDFAIERPGSFKVTFGRTVRPSASTNEDLRAASDRAFELMAAEIRRTDPTVDLKEFLPRALFVWSFVHGLASLLSDQRMGFLEQRNITDFDLNKTVDMVIAEFERNFSTTYES